MLWELLNRRRGGRGGRVTGRRANLAGFELPLDEGAVSSLRWSGKHRPGWGGMFGVVSGFRAFRVRSPSGSTAASAQKLAFPSAGALSMLGRHRGSLASSRRRIIPLFRGPADASPPVVPLMWLQGTYFHDDTAQSSGETQTNPVIRMD